MRNKPDIFEYFDTMFATANRFPTLNEIWDYAYEEGAESRPSLTPEQIEGIAKDLTQIMSEDKVTYFGGLQFAPFEVDEILEILRKNGVV